MDELEGVRLGEEFGDDGKERFALDVAADAQARDDGG